MALSLGSSDDIGSDQIVRAEMKAGSHFPCIKGPHAPTGVNKIGIAKKPSITHPIR